MALSLLSLFLPLPGSLIRLMRAFRVIRFALPPYLPPSLSLPSSLMSLCPSLAPLPSHSSLSLSHPLSARAHSFTLSRDYG